MASPLVRPLAIICGWSAIVAALIVLFARTEEIPEGDLVRKPQLGRLSLPDLACDFVIRKAAGSNVSVQKCETVEVQTKGPQAIVRLALETSAGKFVAVVALTRSVWNVDDFAVASSK